MKIKNVTLTDKQQELIDQYIEKYGAVDVLDMELFIQLQLDKNMILMEGLPYSWLERFNEEFYEITVGLSSRDGYGMYITLFKIDPFNN